MLTQQQKQEIIELLEEEKERLGTFRAVAKKCNLSEASISQLRKGTYAGETDAILHNIGLALGYEFNTGEWRIAETTNFRTITEVLTDAKNESMFIGIAHCAGSGKTATSDAFLNLNRRASVFKINAKEWNAHSFLMQIAHEIGAPLAGNGYIKVNALIDSIGATFKRLGNAKPLLIVDQANSLKPSALRTFIHLYNECEDVLGVVILGTENLETEIKRGVRLNKTGYDEFDSRFGRNYIHLMGASLADTRKICIANGIDNADMQKSIFERAEPTKTIMADGRSLYVVNDVRRIKRLIKSERIKMKYNE